MEILYLVSSYVYLNLAFVFATQFRDKIVELRSYKFASKSKLGIIAPSDDGAIAAFRFDFTFIAHFIAGTYAIGLNARPKGKTNRRRICPHVGEINLKSGR